MGVIKGQPWLEGWQLKHWVTVDLVTTTNLPGGRHAIGDTRNQAAVTAAVQKVIKSGVHCS